MAEAKNKNYIHAVGRRKEAVARLRLYTASSGLENVKAGDIILNGEKIEKYFPGKIEKILYEAPLLVTKSLGKYTISIKVTGGGRSGQLDAVILGISRALSIVDPKNKEILRKAGMLTRDARIRQRRKVGMGGKSRRKRQSPKR